MTTEEEQNPFLPKRPADGQHVWSDGLGWNRRCNLCGAYRGSDEGKVRCLGEFRESGKMRAWARERWTEQRLLGNLTPRQIIRINTSELAHVTRAGGGVAFGGSTTYSALLECGCERAIDYEAHDAIHWGHVTTAGCLGTCPTHAAEESDKLNGRTP